MASISPPSPHKLAFTARKRLPYPSPKPQFPSRYPLSRLLSDSALCRCTDSSNNPSIQWRWDAALQAVFKNAVKSFDSYMNPTKKGVGKEVVEGEIGEEEEDGDGVEWDWDRWRLHFDQVDEQQRLVSLLKSQLGNAVNREDYEDAARIKVAIAAAATNDTVGRVMSQLNRALAQERYLEAAFLRDNAGAGLVGWWSGISEDVDDPYGLIIRITAEHGRYVARSYSPRQLATAAVGVPLFEIFLTMNKKGEFNQQAVYLKRKGTLQDSSTFPSKASDATSRLNPSGPTEDKSDLFVVSTEEIDDADDAEDGSDLAEGLPGFQNILRDMVPGVKVKVLKVTTPAKMDKDFISKVIEQIIDEEDDKDIELESEEAEDDGKGESDHERDEIEMDAGHGIIDYENQSEIAVKVVVGGLAQKLSGSVAAKGSIRVPAKLDRKGRKSFSFSIEKEVNQQNAKELSSVDKKAKLRGQRSVDHVMFDLAKFIGSEKIPLKVLKDVGELINATLSQAQNRQPLSGSTTFHRIEISTSPDPLNGLYIGAHGLYTSEVIHLQRKFESSNLEFYEYVEAVKLTGDPYVPAGQLYLYGFYRWHFVPRLGKRYQLPHRGIIPEEFGVIARYKGQGRLAEPGFQNHRWVDGELVILDGKYIKGGPVVGFVYWAPEYHFLVFFNRLRLQH
ncbi:protein EXECUTER [Salix suchowensis]|nr:protein EXECUTER [Salix suchowensis]